MDMLDLLLYLLGYTTCKFHPARYTRNTIVQQYCFLCMFLWIQVRVSWTWVPLLQDNAWYIESWDIFTLTCSCVFFCTYFMMELGCMHECFLSLSWPCSMLSRTREGLPSKLGHYSMRLANSYKISTIQANCVNINCMSYHKKAINTCACIHCRRYGDIHQLNT